METDMIIKILEYGNLNRTTIIECDQLLYNHDDMQQLHITHHTENIKGDVVYINLPALIYVMNKDGKTIDKIVYDENSNKSSNIIKQFSSINDDNLSVNTSTSGYAMTSGYATSAGY